MVDCDVEPNTTGPNVNQSQTNDTVVDTRTNPVGTSADPALSVPTQPAPLADDSRSSRTATSTNLPVNQQRTADIELAISSSTHNDTDDDESNALSNALAFYKGAPPYLLNDKLQKYSHNGIGYPGVNGTGDDKAAEAAAAAAAATATNIKKADFEQAIELAGYGKFHYLLLAICGLVSTSEEMDVISMSFILPSAQCDLDLNTQTKGWLNSIIFIGMMVGAYVWGSIADTMGRKKVLIVISIMNALCIVASSFCQSYMLFMVFRFLNGVALGGSGPVIWSYFAEFQPKAKRGSMLSFMAAFWTIGNLFVAGLAWLIIPSSIGFYTTYFTYNSWRIFLLICAMPSFLVAALLFYLPESPKFLIMQGRHEKALNILQTIYAINTGRPKECYPVKELLVDEKFNLAIITTSEKGRNDPTAHIDDVKKKGKYSTMFSNIADNSKGLFMSPILKFTIVSISINFTFHIGYYGLMMWFPELFNRFDEYSRAHPGQSASVCQVTEYVVTHGSHSKLGVCTATISSSVFRESLISLSAALPANLIAVLGMDKLGRKFFLIFSTITAAACSAGMYFVNNKQQNFIVSAVFTGVIACGNASLDCLITEVFPTHLRATGVAISMVAARLGGIIGNVVISTLLDLYCPAPTFIVAVLLAGGGLMSLMLPNTTKTALT